MIEWKEEWVEVLSAFFVVLGFILSILLQSPGFSYITIILSGLMAGRVYYTKRYKEPILPSILIIAGFLVGYLIGSIWISRFWVLVFFLAAFYLSYYLHLKKILVIFKSEDFLK